MGRDLVPWKAPKWVPDNVNASNSKVKLGNTPTPIETWDLTNLGFQFPIYIKRDDLTGASLTGNKVRKQEFLLADAIRNGCDSIIAWGPATSNHCRTTALCCAKMGLKCHILLTSKDKSAVSYNSGNIVLASAAGANIYKMPMCSYGEANARMEKLREKLKSEGKKPYCLPMGGSCPESIDFFTDAKKCLEETGITDVPIEDIVGIIDGYVGEGYGDTWPELRQFSLGVARETGIILDTSYTCKAVYALREELRKNPNRFKGNKILFMHTGGIFGFIDGTMTEEIKNTNPVMDLDSIIDF